MMQMQQTLIHLLDSRMPGEGVPAWDVTPLTTLVAANGYLHAEHTRRPQAPSLSTLTAAVRPARGGEDSRSPLALASASPCIFHLSTLLKQLACITVSVRLRQ